MPLPDPVRADGRRNQELILTVAAQVFADSPQATVADVAQAAGLTRATVYRHYSDRDALLVALMKETASAHLPDMLEQMRRLSIAKAMTLLADAVVRIATEHAGLLEATSRQIEGWARVAVEGEPIEAELAARRAAGEFESTLSDSWLATCVRLLCVATVQQLADSGRTPEDLADQLARTLRILVRS